MNSPLLSLLWPANSSLLGLPKYIASFPHLKVATQLYLLSLLPSLWSAISWGSESESRSVVPNSLRPFGLYSPWDSPGQNTGVGSRSLLQGIFPTQGSNPGLPHCRWIFYQLSHKGSLRILEWVAYPFSSGSSRPGNWTGISCIAGGFFTNWAMREARAMNGEGNGTPLQYSCLENPMNRGAW